MKNEITLRALPWADFIAQLKKTALTPGWDNVVFRSMVNVRQPRNESCCNWMNGVRGANFSLTNTCFHKDAIALHAHLESHMSDDLADFIASLTKAERDRVQAIVNLEEWLCELMEIDDNMLKLWKWHEELLEKAFKQQCTSYCIQGTALRGTLLSLLTMQQTTLLLCLLSRVYACLPRRPSTVSQNFLHSSGLRLISPRVIISPLS